MGKGYVRISNDQRKELLYLVHDLKHTIYKASKILNIPYANGKMINKIYTQDKRVA